MSVQERKDLLRKIILGYMRIIFIEMICLAVAAVGLWSIYLAWNCQIRPVNFWAGQIVTWSALVIMTAFGLKEAKMVDEITLLLYE